MTPRLTRHGIVTPLETPRRLHLVDGTYELFRAHFSKRPSHSAPNGSDVKATLGVVSSLLALLQSPEEQVTHLAVAFDNPIRSFRNRLFEGYKTEEGVPPELLEQFDLVEQGVAALGVVVWSMEEYEADDALASGAAQFKDQVGQVRILTPDKDLGQCIEGTRVVQVNRGQNKEIDEAGLRAMRGIGPRSIPDWLALIGDTADGIPGLKGFGEKTASALLGKFPHLEDIPPSAVDWKVEVRGAPKLAQTLLAHREEASLYRKLATLVEDVPLAEPLEALRWAGAPRERFATFCEVLGATTLKTRPHRWQENG